MVLEVWLSDFDPFHYMKLSYNTMNLMRREESSKLNFASFE